MKGGLLPALLAGGLLCALRAALPGIGDPSEGRYAQISFEMEEFGDWLVPRWNGVAHLEKPPLAYWAGAAGIRIFGRNEFGVRFFSVAALLLSALLASDIARRCGGSRPAAVAATLLCPFPLAVGGAILTDGFVMLAATLFHDALFRRIDGEPPRVLWRAGVALAIGFLAKGHVVLLFTVVPALAARAGRARDLLRPAVWLVFLLLAAPWFVAVALRYREFVSIHGTKLFNFLLTGKEHHSAPVFIYLVAITAGFFPFVCWARAGIFAIEGARRRLLLAWLWIPFLLLTAVPSRQVTYVLPACPALVIAAARGLARTAFRPPSVVAAIASAVSGAVLLLLPLFLPDGRMQPSTPLLVGGALLLAAPVLFRAGAARPVAAAGAGALLFGAGYVAASLLDEPLFKVNRSAAAEARALAGEEGPVIVAGFKAPSIPFYLGRRVVVSGLRDRVAEQAEIWGGSEWIRPEEDVEELLRSDTRSVILVDEPWRKEHVPERLPRRVFGNVAVLAPR